MASSSRNNKKYDVFVSFRGEDTRDNFTSHLYSALSRKNIQTFIDDHINRGDEIPESLVNAIEASAISVIIFSERYASSRWCLDELVKILEFKREYAQIVIPVFYRVDPSDLRNQSGTFGDSYLKLEERFKENSKKLQSWRNALKEAAGLSGFYSQNFRPESELIKEVLNQILKRLAEVFPRDNNNQLVGVESRVVAIQSLLGAAPLLGIWGIGGIGKTIIARAIFDKISSDFEGSCFLENVREESQRSGGLACLRQELLSKLLKHENVILDIDLNFRRLSRMKVLIVFDDVTCFRQIKSLIRSPDWFMADSRIIITTRNKQVLRNCSVKEIYEMKELRDDHALELFSRHAFKQNHPDVGYEELSSRVIQYAQGVPLALEILGCSLFEKEKEVWESAINKLKRFLHPSIQEVLKVSYDGLDDNEKNIFLDVACFFKGEDVYPVMKFLDASGFYPTTGISVLVDKSLIAISYNKIMMHDLLQELGREIVRQESINPRNRSRLWHHEDIYEVLKYNMGTEKIEGICLDMSKVKEMHLNSDTFTKMPKLRFLKFYRSSINGENKCKVSYLQGPGFAEMRYLYWYGYPLKSLPSNIHPEKLVLLEMPHSNIQQIWDGIQQQHHGKLKQIIISAGNFFTKTPKPSFIPYLKELVILNLRGCKGLKKLPEISSLSNIEKIILSGTAIEELPSSVGCLSGLVLLHLQACKMLKSLPCSLFKLKSLEDLNLCRCSNLRRFPEEIGNVEASNSLYAYGTASSEVPSSIVRSNNFRFLSFRESRGDKQMGLSLLISLSSDGLHSLKSLCLHNCGVTRLPESLGRLSLLEELDLRRNNFERVPESIIQLSKLNYLYLSYCQRLQSLPELPCNLILLYADHCTVLKSISGLSGLTCSRIEYNCQYFDLRCNFKLDRNEIRGIVGDALRKVQLMATASWKEVRKRISYPALEGYVILPGNEIPKWFRFQSVGSSSSITLEMLAAGCFNKNRIIGFAFSAIVAFCVKRLTAKLFCEFKFKPKDRDPHVIETSFQLFTDVESDHILLGYYFFREEDFNILPEYYCSLEAVQFYFKEAFCFERLECCGVKKCGIHLFHSPDPSGSFKCNEEEKEEP
ncbi:Disease resistance-like protein DSC1 [Citrus sinensis]|nr:Disease resistance-like protein DSC1 [Citrus sinensis]